MATTTPAAPENVSITPPFAYTEIVPLRKEHRVLVPQRGRIPPAFRRIRLTASAIWSWPPGSRFSCGAVFPTTTSWMRPSPDNCTCRRCSRGRSAA